MNIIEEKFQIEEFTVSQISKKIKILIEDKIGFVKIKGEISGFKRASSGHLYFSLKDDRALISAVFFRGQSSNINFNIEDGLEVVATGRITTYEGRSNYQIIVEKLEKAGIGELMAMIEARRRKFLSLGYFDEKHKKKLPFWPSEIGVITSKTGAVIHDILHRVKDRFPTKISLYPVSVQGKNAHTEIIQAINYFENLKNKPNLLIIARGGGSFEDLLPFSEESLVERVFSAKIPIISAIGHETDTSLIDYVSDVRAPTPTAAAEIATPILSELNNLVKNLSDRSKSQIIDFLQRKEQDIDKIERFIRDPRDYLNKLEKKLEDSYKLLTLNIKNNISQKEQKINLFVNLFKDFDYKISVFEKNLGLVFDKISQKMIENLSNYQNRIDLSTKLLDSFDYKNVLKRGYALIQNDNGKFLKNIQDLEFSKNISIEMSDGKQNISIKRL
jgi:exodeoxyribonuclease VII large subunit